MRHFPNKHALGTVVATTLALCGNTPPEGAFVRIVVINNETSFYVNGVLTPAENFGTALEAAHATTTATQTITTESDRSRNMPGFEAKNESAETEPADDSVLYIPHEIENPLLQPREIGRLKVPESARPIVSTLDYNQEAYSPSVAALAREVGACVLYATGFDHELRNIQTPDSHTRTVVIASYGREITATMRNDDGYRMLGIQSRPEGTRDPHLVVVVGDTGPDSNADMGARGDGSEVFKGQNTANDNDLRPFYQERFEEELLRLHNSWPCAKRRINNRAAEMQRWDEKGRRRNAQRSPAH
ncbi:hypothetical protein COV82_06125 [Candidatus Peregrinibacteria bacterium CG11_big_fil_rev_8_21_14_0_20_46_8]|nr:MAG: hypothetical protein COV82_06125 [Candidatus Peregrinibacteria bacterium CG11_big_fil_rev_8_21_14_0_20_46_8]